MVRTGRNSLLQGRICNQRKGCVSCFSSFCTCISSLIPLGCRTSEISNPSGGRMGSRACFARKVCLYLLCCLDGITWDCEPKNQMFPWSDTHYTIHLAFVTFKGYLESGVCDRLSINMSIWYSLCLDIVQVAMSVNYMGVASDSPERHNLTANGKFQYAFVYVAHISDYNYVCVCGVGEMCPVSASFLKHSTDFYLGKFCAVTLTIGYPWSLWKLEGYFPCEMSMKQTGLACLWMRNEVPVALKGLVFQPHHDIHTPFMPSHLYLPSNSEYQMEVKIY